MAERGIALEGANVVVRGAFDSSVLRPAWFRDNGLVGDLELLEQEIDLVTPELSSFRLGWLSCNLASDSLLLSVTEVEELPRLRDAVVGALRLLEGTRISALGINRETHTVLQSMTDLHAIGDAIAPKEVWESAIRLPGTRSATIWGLRPGFFGGRIQVQVEPSTRVGTAVFVSVNDHYSLSDQDEYVAESRDTAFDLAAGMGESTEEKLEVAIQILTEEWDNSMARAENLRQTVIGLAAAR